MNKTLLLFIFIFFSITTYGQLKDIWIIPETGLSLPSGEFNDVNVFAGKGIQTGVNLDLLFGEFGLGLYGGIDRNDIKFDDLLPPNTNGLIPSKSGQGSQDFWKQINLGLGPVFKMELTKKFDLELSTKFGLTKFSYPDFEQSIDVAAPLNQEYLLYKTKNEDIEKKFNAMFLSSAKLNFKISEKIGIALSANYKNVQGVLHSYTYLDGGFNPGMSNEEVVAALRTAPMVTDKRICNFNSIGITLGVRFNLGGGKDKPKDEDKYDVKMEPPVTSYPEDGSIISTSEADSLELQWRKETPNVDRANYNLWLYEVRDSSSISDSLILKAKINGDIKLLLPDNINLEDGKTYRWEVRAIDAAELKPCPQECYSNKATFKISTSNQVQYYHLLTQNVGNYIENNGPLRFLLPNHIEVGGKVQARILNQNNEEVLFIEVLQINTKGENYSIDEFGRVAVNTGRLPDGYYLLEVFNENKKDYYLRFLIDKTANDEKD